MAMMMTIQYISSTTATATARLTRARARARRGCTLSRVSTSLPTRISTYFTLRYVYLRYELWKLEREGVK